MHVFKEQKLKTQVSLIKEVLFTNKSFLSSQIKFFLGKGADGALWWDHLGGGRGGRGLGSGWWPRRLKFII